MNFAITSETGDKIYEGQIITYKVSPMPMMRMSWVTEITKIEEGRMFIDEQRFGPYRMWHHEHQLEANGKETLMTDIVSYKVPFGPLGKLMHGLMIQRQLEGIFSHRSKVMDKLFPASQPTQFTSPKPESEMISA